MQRHTKIKESPDRFFITSRVFALGILFILGVGSLSAQDLQTEAPEDVEADVELESPNAAPANEPTVTLVAPVAPQIQPSFTSTGTSTPPPDPFATSTLPSASEPASATPEGPKGRELFAVKNVPQTLNFEFEIGEIAIGNPGVVSVVADRPRRRIVLSPLEAGETALLVFDTQGRQRESIQITVTSTDLDQFIKDLRFLFRDIEGLQFRRVGRKIVLEGEVYLQSDTDRIRDVLRGNDFVVNLVTLSQDTQRILARRIKNEINISGVDVTVAKDRFVLKGEVTSEDEQKRAEKIAEIYADKDKIVNVISVNPKKSGARAAKLIQVTAYFVELNKSFLRNFNFSWTPIANTQFSYTPGAGGATDFNFFAIITDFLPKLNTAKGLGVARVIENPTVSVKSGDSANVKAGGQISFPIPQGQAVSGGSPESQNEKEVGVDMNVTPAADERDFVDLKIGVTVKKLGSAIQEGGILIQTSSINTSHYVRSGETVAIGGVLRSSFTDVKDAPPSIPFAFQPPQAQGASFENSFGNIFQVFKSRSTTQDRSMFIVFVTPEILNSARDSSRQLREQFNLNSVEQKPTEGVEEFD